MVNDRARWYQVQTGEFTTRDPAFASTDTAYTYAGDEPVNEVDPNGMLLVGPGGAGTVAYFNCGQVSSGSEMSFSTARRSQCLFYSFVEHGYSEYAAAAVVGNIYVESSGIDSGGPLPNTTGDPMLAWQATGAGCGLTTNLSARQSAEEIAANCMNVGIAQWGLGPGYSSNPRVAGLIDYARQQGQPWWDFDTQVGYIFKELGSSSLMVNGYTGTEVASALKTCGTSLYNCTYDFMYGYEGPQANTAQLRTFYAQLALNAWRGVASYGLTCDLWAGWQHAAIVAGE